MLRQIPGLIFWNVKQSVPAFNQCSSVCFFYVIICREFNIIIVPESLLITHLLLAQSQALLLITVDMERIFWAFAYFPLVLT